MGYKTVFTYISALGFALTLLEALDPLLKLSKIATLILKYWEEFIIGFWGKVLFFVNIDLSPEVYKALTTSLLFLALGFFSSERVVSIIKQTPARFSVNDKWFSNVFNIIFLLGFSILNLVTFYESVFNVSSLLSILQWSAPFLILSYALLFLSIKIAIAPLLRRKIIVSLIILLTIIVLDAIYEPLQNFLA